MWRGSERTRQRSRLSRTTNWSSTPRTRRWNSRGSNFPRSRKLKGTSYIFRPNNLLQQTAHANLSLRVTRQSPREAAAELGRSAVEAHGNVVFDKIAEMGELFAMKKKIPS